MREPLTVTLTPRMSRAVEEAEVVLAGRGFANSGNGVWLGKIGSHRDVKVALPPSFPFELPEVYVSPPAEPIPHIDDAGKLCLIAPTSQMVDTSRPGDVIRDVLLLSERILDADNTTFERETALEYQRYWSLGGQGSFLLLSSIPGKTTLMVSGQFKDGQPKHYIAKSERDARQWASHTGREIGDCRPAIFTRLQRLPRPPAPHKPLKLRKLLDKVSKAGGDIEGLWKSLVKCELPVLCVFAVSTAVGDEEWIFGAYVRELYGDALKQSLKGWRAEKVTPARRIKCAMNQPVEKVFIRRADAGFLMTRAGAVAPLQKKKVAVIGCGAVGSHFASALAEVGVGSLILVDPDSLEPGNVHRHLLGLAQVGQNKAEGIERFLRAQYPHIRVDSYALSIEEVFESEVCGLDDSDLLVSAMAEPTIELMLNEYLGSSKLRMHVWLEPLGLGGHILTTGLPRSGCFACLYRPDPNHGLVCRSDLAAPGQSFLTHHGGCSGAFTPFSGLDARSIVTAAVRRAVRLLLDERSEPTLTTWMGERGPFEQAGFRVSQRAHLLKSGEVRDFSNFVRDDCSVCGAPAWHG